MNIVEKIKIDRDYLAVLRNLLIQVGQDLNDLTEKTDDGEKKDAIIEKSKLIDNHIEIIASILDGKRPSVDARQADARYNRIPCFLDSWAPCLP